MLVRKFGSAALITVMAGGSGGTENRLPEGGFDQLDSSLALA
jgi:hypothetical protein